MTALHAMGWKRQRQRQDRIGRMDRIGKMTASASSACRRGP